MRTQHNKFCREPAGHSSLRPSADAASRPHLEIQLDGQAPAAADRPPPASQASTQVGQGQGPGRGQADALPPQPSSSATAAGDDIEWI